MIKGGGTLGGLAFSRVQGGWRIWDTRDVLVTTLDDELRTSPRFLPFLEYDLFSEDVVIGSNLASESRVVHDVLARGIPAMSFGAAANAVQAISQGGENFDMEAKGRLPDAWPTEGHEGFRANQWIHSDFKNVALPYVSSMYEALISKGELSY
jgi:hypothetical protein